MLKKLKDIRVILIIVLVLFLIIGGVLFYLFKVDMDEKLLAKDADIQTLQSEIAAIGELVPAYTVAADVPSGKEIEESDLTLIDVPLSMATNLVQDSEELIGKHFKVPMTAGSVITIDCIYEEVITNDMRYYDLIVDVLPIGLQPGAYVDIRIRFGTGTDLVGVVHRQVAEINGNALKMILTEEDIQMYSAMMVDNIVYNTQFQSAKDEDGNGIIDDRDKVDAVGSYIYCVEYVMGGAQSQATAFYAPSAFVQAIISKNPNIDEATYTAEELMLKRNWIEAGLGEYNDTASSIRNVVNTAVDRAKTEYDKRLQEELRAAQEAGY